MRQDWDASSMALQDGEHTACGFPMNLRVAIKDRMRCLPHRKHDIVEVLKWTVSLKGDPPTLDL